MSIAQRDKPNAPSANLNSNDNDDDDDEDEGKLAPVDDNPHSLRFLRTNQAFNAIRGGISDAKLYIYAKTGQILESEDSNDILIAFQKLDSYREQISLLLINAEHWTQSMFRTWNYQTTFLESLNECHTVINSFNKIKSVDKSLILRQQTQEFSNIVAGISAELYLNLQESEKRYGHASSLLVIPLKNILNHEIAHAIDIRKKYIIHKRQYDNCCTNITNIRNNIIDNKIDKNDKNDNNTSFSKLKIGFLSKIINIQSNPTQNQLKNQLNDARSQLKDFIKIFEETKKKFKESINIIEQKLNIEVVYYIKQFYEYVKKWKNNSNNNNNSDDIKQNDDNNDDNVINDIVNDIVNDLDDNNDNKQDIQSDNNDLVSTLQIDAMINDPGMDDVDLNDQDNIDDNPDDNDNIVVDDKVDDVNDISQDVVLNNKNNNNPPVSQPTDDD